MGTNHIAKHSESGTSTATVSTASGAPWFAVSIALVLSLSALLFTIRVCAPPNLLDQDQERPASYVLDVVQNGSWICQQDWTGDITSKPPLWTWLAALFTLVTGRISVVSLYLPGALGATGSALLIYSFGRTRFGERAALLGAIASILTTAAAKQFGLARTDGVFAFAVTLAALLAYRSWTRQRGWMLFWLAASAATLTKGPVGLLLAAFGLLAAVWEYRTVQSTGQAPAALPIGRNFRKQVPGILVYLILTGGWFALAYWQLGQAVIDKLIGKELVGHAVTSSNRNIPGLLIWQQPLYYLSRALPWSLVAYYGLWRIWCRPAAEVEERRFERFLFCWFCAGLLLFSLAPHQRADLLWPLMPAGALIAGRELDRWARRFSPGKFAVAYGACVLLGLVGLGWYYFVAQAKQAVVRQTVALKELAESLEQKGWEELPLTYIDAPMTLQVYLQTVRVPVTFERAANLLRSAEPAFVAVTDVARLEAERQPEDAAWYRLSQSGVHLRKRAVTLLSNRQDWGNSQDFAVGWGPWNVRAANVRLLRAKADALFLQPISNEASVVVRNDGTQPGNFAVRWTRAAQNLTEARTLPAGRTATFHATH